MWKIRELTDKVTNVVMNYSEVETKVREATNDDSWGPHGQLMKEIAQYTFTYEHFPEVMGMLWKRMLHENKKNWRRVYKSLILLAYLIKNGSERVVTSAREHIYDLRGLESYSFTDENGKDQGMNVRHKVKELMEFIQDDERLREERKKAKKTKDKFVGLSSDLQEGGGGSKYSDRYDEEPRARGGRRMGEIDDWTDGRPKSMVGEAIDKAKDLWNRVSDRRGPENEDNNDDDLKERHKEKDLPEREWDRGESRVSREREQDDLDDRERKRERQFKDEFRDDDEYTSVEQTQTTRTEKIVTNRRTRSVGKKLDLCAAGSTGEMAAPSLIDMGHPGQGGGESGSDFSAFQGSKSNSTDDFDPRGSAVPPSNGEFGDFSGFQTGTATSPVGSQGFADFSQFNSAAGQSTSTHMGQVTAPASSSADLFDVFVTPVPASNPTMNMMNMTATSQVSMTAGMSLPMMGMPGAMGMQAPGMVPQGMGMTGLSPLTPSSGNVGWGMSAQKTMPTTWSDTKIDISLDALGPAGRQGKTSIPSLNAMSQQGGMASPVSPVAAGGQGMLRGVGMIGVGAATPAMMGMPNAPGMKGPGVMVVGGAMMGPGGMAGMNQGMAGMNQSMAGMSLQGGTINMMGPRPMMGQPMGYGMGMQPGMMGMPPGMGMGGMPAMSRQQPQSVFQQRTDQAFSGLGSLK